MIFGSSTGNCNDEDDEYSTSSRLHLAGAVSSTNGG